MSWRENKATLKQKNLIGNVIYRYNLTEGSNEEQNEFVDAVDKWAGVKEVTDMTIDQASKIIGLLIEDVDEVFIKWKETGKLK